jgi:hypothetical protein
MLDKTESMVIDIGSLEFLLGLPKAPLHVTEIKRSGFVLLGESDRVNFVSRRGITYSCSPEGSRD